jgi:hypothetical protein
VAVALVVAFGLPNLSASAWVASFDPPAFFSDGSCHRYLAPRDVVLTLPWRESDMLWQVRCGMGFRNVAGFTGLRRLAVSRWPIVNYFGGDRAVPEPGLQLKAFVASMGVSAIAIDDRDPDALELKALIASLGVTPREISGVSLYRIPLGSFASYRANAVTMEARADRISFDTLLAASAAYLAAGHEPDRIGRNELVKLGYLSPKWAYHLKGTPDASVAYESGGVAIRLIGTRAGLRDLIAYYLGRARLVLYPYPRILGGTEQVGALTRALRGLLPVYSDNSDGGGRHLLSVVFSVDQLKGSVRTTNRRAARGAG